MEQIVLHVSFQLQVKSFESFNPNKWEKSMETTKRTEGEKKTIPECNVSAFYIEVWKTKCDAMWMETA